MKVCLISPPTLTQFNGQQVIESEAVRLISQHAPLGILSLAAVLDARGAEPHIVDLNRLYYEYVTPGPPGDVTGDFASYVVRRLEGADFDVFGFGTICSSYPLTLRIAQGVRRTHPGSAVVLGGPQASVVDVLTLRAFPFVDYVVRGEAEETLPRLLDAVASGGSGLAHVGGVTYRAGGEVVRNPPAPVIADLDTLPMPAYDLYPHIRDCTYAPLEGGRGCPFACSFCSTNDFFRRRYRMKSPAVLVGQMKLMKERYGISNFDLVHDMFTVDRKKVVAFCDAVEESGERLHWNCSARTDCLDQELIKRMARAGCVGVFFGVDTGSERMQGVINKGLNLGEAAARVGGTSAAGMKTMVSLIAGFPEETKDDLRATVRFLGDSLRHRRTDVQFHLLAPLAETPITSRHREQLVYDEIFSDVSMPDWEQDAADRALIVAHRDIFTSFYAVPTQSLDRRYLMDLREFLLRGVLTHRWLMLTLHRDAGDLMRVFDGWAGWLRARRGLGDDWETRRDYYQGNSFQSDLLDFTRSHYLHAARHPHLVSTMAAVEAALLHLREETADTDGEAPRARRRRARYGADEVPVVAAGVRLVRADADYKRLVRCLRRNERLERVPAGRCTLMLQRSGEEIKVVQLGPVTQQLLSSCDGTRSLLQVADGFTPAEAVEGVPARQVGLYGLSSLLRRGVISIKADASR